jgi:hypothetical protein
MRHYKRRPLLPKPLGRSPPAVFARRCGGPGKAAGISQFQGLGGTASGAGCARSCTPLTSRLFSPAQRSRSAMSWQYFPEHGKVSVRRGATAGFARPAHHSEDLSHSNGLKDGDAAPRWARAAPRRRPQRNRYGAPAVRLRGCRQGQRACCSAAGVPCRRPRPATRRSRYLIRRCSEQPWEAAALCTLSRSCWEPAMWP